MDGYGGKLAIPQVKVLQSLSYFITGDFWNNSPAALSRHDGPVKRVNRDEPGLRI
jgi:hypothetical protein